MNDLPSGQPATPVPTPEPEMPDRSRQRPGPRGAAAYLIFGVVLPVVTLLFECFTGAAADYFETIPTWWHALMIALVPFSNGLVLLQMRRDEIAPLTRRWLPWLNALSIGIAGYYAVAFLPLMPFAVIGIVIFGIGLLALAPFFALLFAALLRRQLNRSPHADLPAPRLTRWGILVGVGCVGWINAHNLITDVAVNTVASTDATRPPIAALTWLRLVADDSYLVTCATDRRRSTEFWSIFNNRNGRPVFVQPKPSDYQIAIYRATGLPVSRIAPTGSAFGRLGRDTGADDWVWDESLGQQRIGQRLRALHLTDSRIDGTVDAHAAVGYTEWTLVFRNDHKFQQREARALVQLPPGGVVSRLTLWINGEPCEAAFGGTAQVTQAYQAVVRQRRDPVLVTYAGPDQVLMQCFPVPPAGGEMKVRLGITYPLALTADGRARGALPALIEQNFSMAPAFSHTVWIDSANSLSATHPALTTDATAVQSRLRGTINANELAAGTVLFEANRADSPAAIWAQDPHEPSRKIVQQLVPRPGRSSPPTLVIDGSVHMAATGRALAAALSLLDPSTPVNLFLAGDRVLQPPRADAATAAAWLREQRFVGGQDCTAALTLAYDVSAGRPDAAILWLHGPIPHTWQETGPLLQRFQRAPGAVALLDYSNGFGASPRMLEIAEAAPLQRIHAPAPAAADLSALLREISPPRLSITRRIATDDDAALLAQQPAASAHVTRLWAFDEVRRLIANRASESARQLAITAQLVTPVSGAVVLETKAQYDAAGLKPVDSATTPDIPEPATVAVLMGAAVLVFTMTKRRRTSRAPQRVGGSR